LKSSRDGYIHVITNKHIAGVVAESQLHTRNDYGVVRIILKGVTGVIENDDVEEFTARFQRRIKQDFIEPKYLGKGDMYHGVNCKYDIQKKEFLCHSKRAGK
jgi:hypothetical protein